MKPEVLGKHILVAHDQLHHAEEFARIWDEAKQDLAKGAVASVGNMVEWVITAREGFNDKPKNMLVLLQREGKVSAYHVPADALR